LYCCFCFLNISNDVSLNGRVVANRSVSTTWGNIKTGTGVNSDSAKLAPPVGSYTKLVVPFYPQVSLDSPPGDWKLSMNCGQASVLTCVGYAKRVYYPYPAPIIVKENEWLAKNTNTKDGPKYLNKYGYFTGGGRISYLEDLARNYWGFKNSVAIKGNSCGTIDALYNELTAGRPVIVEVITNMAPAAVEGGDTYHFMVLVGMRIRANNVCSDVWVNDVGKPNGRVIIIGWNNLKNHGQPRAITVCSSGSNNFSNIKKGAICI